MADVGVCNPSGCYGRCPTSTRCSRRSPCPPVSPCPPGGYVQRGPCGCGCRWPAPEKCPLGVRVKDYLNVIAEDLHYFKAFYKLFRSTPRMPNKPSQMPKGPDGKPLMKGGGKKGGGKKDGDNKRKNAGEGDEKTDGLFDHSDDGGGLTGHGRRPSQEARLKNKLNSLFDEALINGMLDDRGKKGKKRSPEYYKEKLGISISCIKDCEPLCCDE